MTERNAMTIVVVSADAQFVERVSNALFPHFQVVHGNPSGDNVEGLIASCNAAACIVDIDGASWDQEHETGLIGKLRGQSEQLPIIFATFDLSSATLIPAFRSGANDVLDKDFAPDELLAQADRLANRRMARLGHEAAPLCTFVGAREGHGKTTTTLAVSEILAERATSDERILLLDFSHPPAKIPDLVGMRATYYMTDGVHDLPRLDATMIDSAILRASPQSLYVLPLASTERGLNSISIDDVTKLVAVLRTYFSMVVADISWPWRTQLAMRLFLTAEHKVLCTSQSITAIHAASAFLDQVREASGSDVAYLLAVTRHDPALKPSLAEIQKALGAADAPFAIPDDRHGVEMARNAGETLAHIGRRSPFAKAVVRLADAIAGIPDGHPPKSSGLLKKFGWAHHD
jgi:Flp pilus assembly CpaE family ATPase